MLDLNHEKACIIYLFGRPSIDKNERCDNTWIKMLVTVTPITRTTAAALAIQLLGR